MINIEKYFASESFVIQTALSAENVRRIVLEKIEPTNEKASDLFYDYLTRKYEGTVAENIFRISQVQVGRMNSFAPLISGTITIDGNKTEIHIQFGLLPTMKKFFTLFAILMSVLAFIGVIVDLNNMGRNGLHKPSFFLISTGILLFGLLLVKCGPQQEFDLSKRYLQRLLCRS